jgi:integrase
VRQATQLDGFISELGKMTIIVKEDTSLQEQAEAEAEVKRRDMYAQEAASYLISSAVPISEMMTSDRMKAAVTAILLHQRPINTSATYLTYWRNFQRYCQANKQSALPARPWVVAWWLWMLCVRDRMKAGTMSVALAAVVDMHKRAGVDSPAEHYDVKAMLKVVKAKAPHITERHVQAPVLRVSDLRALQEKMTELEKKAKDKKPEHTRDLLLLALMLFTGMRPSEAVGLRIEDVKATVEEQPVDLRNVSAKVARINVLHVAVKKAKNDQFSRGHVRLVPEARMGYLCAIKLWKQWMSIRKEWGTDNGKEPLFCNIANPTPAKSANQPPRQCSGLSSSTPNGIVKKWMIVVHGAEVGKRYQARSARAGFATAAFEHNIPIESIKASGNWLSDAVRTYIRPSLACRIAAAAAVMGHGDARPGEALDMAWDLDLQVLAHCARAALNFNPIIAGS